MEMEKTEEPIIIEQPAASGAPAPRFALFNGGKSSKWVAVAGAGVASLVLTFAGFLLLDALSNPNAATPAPAAGVDYPRLAADLPGRVDIALNNGNAAAPRDLSMLFDNKSNAPGSAATAPPFAGGVPSPQSLPSNYGGSGVTSVPVRAGQSQFPAPPPGSGSNASIGSLYPNAVGAVEAPAATAVQERLKERRAAVRRNEAVAAVWEAYDIEDVVPMGIVGDEKSRDVGFYSPTTKQRFSAPIGARFNNGTLVGAAQKGGDLVGIRFRKAATGETFVRMFTRSAKGKEAEESLLVPDEIPANAAVPTPENRPSSKPPTKRQSARRNNK